MSTWGENEIISRLGAIRDLIKTLVDQYGIVALREGDDIVFAVNPGARFSQAQAEDIQSTLRSLFPGHRVFVTEGGALSVIRHE